MTFSLVLLDLDHFKSINDAFGHLRGDQVLTEFSKRLAVLVRSSDLVFRYGGDEFVILLPHTEKEQAAGLANRLLEEIRSTPFSGEPPLSLSMSMGVACFPEEANTAQALFEIADKRHYEAKQQGRGRIVSEDLDVSESPLLAEPSRLVERDQALKSLHEFFSALAQHKRGVLQVKGEAGCGKSRFLREALQAARLQGYIVLDVHGKPALRNRLYGALSDPLRERNLPSPWDGLEQFSRAIHTLVVDKGSAGLLVIVDDLPDIDQSTIEFLREAFFASHLFQLGMIYSTSNLAARSGLQLDVPVRETVTLDPLTSDGTRVWLRHSLQWEAPQSFVDWFHDESLGLPKWIQKGLGYLVAQGLLQQVSNGWRYEPDLSQVRLGEWLHQNLGQPLHNLPSGLNEFVGREEELGILKKLLEGENLVTLVGPGGIGKTRLAVQAAWESQELFSNGVYLVPLAAVRQQSLVVPAIADVLHYSFSGPEEPANQLISYLRAKELLLILDNLEHLLESVTLLQRILEQAPGVSMLAASHERLGLPGEVIMELSGLPIPQEVNQEQLPRNSAVQLFLSSARQTRPDFNLDSENGAAIMRICQLVEGMPLGVELAASWVGSFSPQEIARFIESTVGFLSTEQATLPERHRSLLTVFDSFCNLLSETELGILRRLAVFRGGFQGEAARRVVGASPFFLDGLAAKTNLRRLPQGRYELHQLWWQYAREKLVSNAQEFIHAQEAHCEYYVLFIQRRESLMVGDRQVLVEINADIANIRAAWEWAESQSCLHCLALASRGMAQYYTLLGLFQEGEALFAQAVGHLRQILAENSLPEIDDFIQKGRRLLGWLLVYQSSFLKDLGRSGEVQPLIQEALELGQHYQDLALQALAMQEWGRAEMVQDLRAARQKVERSIELTQQAQEQTGTQPLANSSAVDLVPVTEHFLQSVEASGNRILGILAARSDNLSVARDFFERALSAQRTLGNLDDESNILNNLGLLADMDGNREQAREYFNQSLQIKRMLGNKTGIAKALHNLGYIASHQGDHRQALNYFEQALAIWRDTGNWSSEGKTLNDLGDIALLQGDLLRAINYQEQAIKIHRQSGSKRGQGEASESLGDVFLHIGNYERAQKHLQTAMSCYTEANELYNQAVVLAKLGILHHALEDEKSALAYLEHSLQLAEELGNPSCQALALNGLGQIYSQNRQVEPAIRAYEQALRFGETSGEVHLVLEPRAGLAQLAFLQGDHSEALAYADQMLQYLSGTAELRVEEYATHGGNTLGKVYLICHRVLEELHDPRAVDILSQGYKLLMTWAQKIADENMRTSFLTNVAVHRELLEEFEHHRL